MTARRSVLSRLRGRSLDELRVRGTQVASRLLERLGTGDVEEPRGDFLPGLLAPGVAPSGTAAWCRAFRARGGERFLPGFNDIEATLTRARALDPDGIAATLRTAERALAGHFDLLGFTDLHFGAPTDWHLDPVTGIRAPRTHWSQVPYLDGSAVGDHKVTWELNRHQWLVALGMAWRLTADARYAVGVAQSLQGWMDANPPKVGINWASSLEVAFRAISWLWTLRLVANAPAVPDALVARAVGHLRLAARHVERNLSTYFSPNTHLTGEALALYYLGHELRDLSEATRWRATGRDVLLTWLPTHVRPDGTYFEQSTWYHRYTLDFYVHFARLAECAGDPLPAGVRDAIGRLGEVLAHVARPDGTIPLIGDDDGGRLLFLDGRTAHDARPGLASAGLASGRGFLCARGAVTTETLCLFGVDADERAHQLAASAVVPAPSRYFADGGLVVLRSGWDAGAAVLTLDAGPHGAMNCGHAHADALAFDLAVAGTPVFVDPGTMVYTVDPSLRDRFRATASHNAATLDGADSSEMAGPFAWGRRANVQVRAWSQDAHGDYVEAGHDGFDGPYVRTIVRLPSPQGDVWIVRDASTADREASLVAHLQCAIGLEVTVVSRGRAAVTRDGRPVATVVAAEGDLSTGPGDVSPVYGVRHAAPQLRVARRSRGAQSVCTVIAPALDNVRAAASGEGLRLELSAAGRDWLVVLGPVSEPSVSLAGRAFWGVRDPGGTGVTWWRAVGAHRAVVDGQVLLSSPEPRDASGRAGDTPSKRN